MTNRDLVEKRLLFNVVKDKNWNAIIFNNLTRDYFSYANQVIYDYIKEIVEQGTYPDLLLLQSRFEISDSQVAEYTTTCNVDEACDVLRKEYLTANILNGLQDLNDNAKELYDYPEKFTDRLGSFYDSIKTLGHGNKSVGLFDDIEELLTIDSSDVISTGFKELDEKLVGWKRGEELVVFMARTGQGKSWLGLKFAMAAALQGERVGIYSGEMSKQQLQERILCCAKQNYTDTKEDALKFINEHDIKNNIKLITQQELRGRANINDIEAFIIRDNLTMLIVDQLSLMEDSTCRPGTPLRQQYGNISMDLFSLTSRYRLPCILLVQSNRQGSDQRNGPALENIAESDAVAQNATRVISMKNENGVLTLNILKNRYGDASLVQKYDVDFGINKYKPIQDYNVNSLIAGKPSKARQVFGGGVRTF